MISIPFSIISSKMLDGFGKSMYSLLFTCIKIGLETCLIYVLNNILSNGSCVLIGITITEIIFAIVYYVFLRYLFKNFDKKYENKDVVKTFNHDNEKESLINDTKESRWKNKTLKKILLNTALVAMAIVVIVIVLSPISLNDYFTFLVGIICLAICTLSIYLITRINKPIISLLGFIISTVILFTFIHNYGNESILYFIIAEILIILIILILSLKKEE